MSRDFITTFYNNFFALKDVPIVLYGIGQYTKIILENVDGFNIIGLMDRNTTGQTIYGYPVISEYEAAEKAVAVIIVANLSVAPIIYDRIKDIMYSHNVSVYYLNGLQPKDYELSIEENLSLIDWEQSLKNKIQEYDVISFDIFDTLIMRMVNKPEDIFLLAEEEVRKKNGISINFANIRKDMEKYCYENVSKYFSFDQIYSEMQKQYSLTDEVIITFKEKELEIERRCLIARNDMKDIFQHAKSLGKKVILVSDMYINTSIINDILISLGIDGADNIFISCDCKADKYWGTMWELVKSQYSGKKLLHIGDNRIADYKTPMEAGIDSWLIENGSAIMDKSGINSYIGDNKFADDFLIRGIITARLINSIYGLKNKVNLEKELRKKELFISNMYDFGYIFMGPVVLKFMIWLKEKVKEEKVNRVLFISRDGYLLEKLYHKYFSYTDGAAKCIYFLSSRRAASVACIERMEDVQFILDKICCTATVEYIRLLKNAFGIAPHDTDEYKNTKLYDWNKKELASHIWMEYKEELINNSKKERVGYQKYIHMLMENGELETDDNLGFVNFVCRGVTQKFVSRIFGKRIKGLYFAKEYDILDIYPYPEDIFSLYDGYQSTHTSRWNLIVQYLFGEAVFSSPDGQLICFDNNGAPVFDLDKGCFDEISKCHGGIDGFFQDILKTNPYAFDGEYSMNIVDKLFGLFAVKGIRLSEDIKKVLHFQDFYGM